LPEVREQRPAAAAGRLAVGQERLQALALGAPVALVAAARRQQARDLHDVLQAVGHERLGRLAVAAGAARLLVVALEALGQVEVRDEPHVRLVDTHPERDGRDHHDAVLAQEALLPLAPLLAGQAGVVGERVDPAGPQPRRGGVHGLAREAVDDAGLACVAVPVAVEEPALDVALPARRIASSPSRSWLAVMVEGRDVAGSFVPGRDRQASVLAGSAGNASLPPLVAQPNVELAPGGTVRRGGYADSSQGRV